MIHTRLSENDLKTVVRDIPDFPKEGIMFKDITPILSNPDAFRTCINMFHDHYKDAGLTGIAAVEARGYMLAAPLAYLLGCSLIPVRKPGKLPYETISQKYDLEYGSNTLEIHKDAVQAADKVLVVDDLIATGGSARATAQLVEALGAKVVGFAFMIELGFLKGRDVLQGYDVYSLITY